MDLQSNCKFTIANAKEITLPTNAIFIEPKGVNVLGIPHFICRLVHHAPRPVILFPMMFLILANRAPDRAITLD